MGGRGGEVGVYLKLDVQGKWGGRILGVDGQGDVKGPKNWIIFMDVICVSCLM